MDAVELMGEHIQHNPNLPAEYDDQSYALGGEKNITSSVYDCTVEDVEYIYNKLSINIFNSKSRLSVLQMYSTSSTVQS